LNTNQNVGEGACPHRGLNPPVHKSRSGKKRKRKEMADVPKEGEGRTKAHPFLPLPIYKGGVALKLIYVKFGIMVYRFSHICSWMGRAS
jgi:hypothetical protein